MTSSISSHEATRLADLEEENDVLRTQLDLEQTESARLRARVESLETSATSSTPFPSFEPTFAFNTADLKPLPQPEELAFVEQRERQKRFGTSASSPPLSIAQIPLPSLPSTSSTSPESSIPDSSSTLMNLDSSRLVAREVELSLPRKLFNSLCLRRLRLRLLSPALLPSLHRSRQLRLPSPRSISPRHPPRPNLTLKTSTTSLLLPCGTSGSSRIPNRKRTTRQ